MTDNTRPAKSGNDKGLSLQKCGHEGVDWNGEGDCITCARDKVLGDTPRMPLETAAGFYWNGKQWESNLGIKMSSGTFSVLNEAIEDWRQQEIAEARIDEINRMRKAMVEQSTPAIYHMNRIEALRAKP